MGVRFYWVTLNLRKLPVRHKVEHLIRDGDMLHFWKTFLKEHLAYRRSIIDSTDEISDEVVFGGDTEKNGLEFELADVVQHLPKASL